MNRARNTAWVRELDSNPSEAIMKRTCLRIISLAALLATAGLAHAQLAPGEDPIHLDGSVQYLALPTPAPPKSKDLDKADDLPGWLQAKISRFEAKAYSATGGDGTIHTDNDVISTTRMTGSSKTCVQEVASNTISQGVTDFNRFGPGQKDQIVVLRGDMVNMCR